MFLVPSIPCKEPEPDIQIRASGLLGLKVVVDSKRPQLVSLDLVGRDQVAAAAQHAAPGKTTRNANGSGVFGITFFEITPGGSRRLFGEITPWPGPVFVNVSFCFKHAWGVPVCFFWGGL